MQYPWSLRLTQSLTWSLTAALVLALAACGSNDDDSKVFTPPPTTTTALKASLSGEQEVPPTLSGALGTGSLSLEAATRIISGSITLDGMTANAAHIHPGETGANGPIIVPLTETVPGTWSVPAGTKLTQARTARFAARSAVRCLRRKCRRRRRCRPTRRALPAVAC
jgi:CHRD domain